MVLIAGLVTSGVSGQPLDLHTQKASLDYSPFVVNTLGGLGLVDITKLEPKEEVASLDIRFATFPSEGLFTGQLVIVDANRNGKFEWDSVDMVGLTSFRESIELNDVNFARSDRPVNAKIGDRIYEILTEEGGEIIRLRQIPGEGVIVDLTFPYLMPDITVGPLTKNATIDKKNGKYTYVEFWGTWCKPCLEIIPDIKQLRQEFPNELNIVSVNWRDRNFDRVKQYIISNKMNWDHVIADATTIKEFAVQYYPCGILFDPDGNLVAYGISPGEVRTYLAGK